MINKKEKIEVKYQSDFSILINRVLTFIGQLIKPIISLFIILIGLYVIGYIVLIVVLFFLCLFLYKKIKRTI